MFLKIKKLKILYHGLGKRKSPLGLDTLLLTLRKLCSIS